MNRVTKIERSEWRGKVGFRIYLNGKPLCILNQNRLLASPAREGAELSDVQVQALVELADYGKLLDSLVAKLARRPHSEQELRQFARQKQVGDPGLIDRALAELTQKKLIDDREFARQWAAMRSRQGKSQRYVRGELRQKGVANEIIDATMGEGENTDRAAIRELIEKDQARLHPREREKLIAYLARRGFQLSDILAELQESA